MTMQNKALTEKKRLILGLGQTGLSVAYYLHKHDHEFSVMDTRDNPPGIDELLALSEESYLVWNADIFAEFDELVVSPGISIALPEIQLARAEGVKIVGDIELFAQVNTTPVIAITGSNGKSTVTDLVCRLINAGGKKALAGGNFGVPALDLIEQELDFIILELSSFQLETTYKLRPIAATVLNVSQDHLDRYDSYQDYIEAKQRVYRNSEVIVINHNDENTWSLDDTQMEFGVIPTLDGEDELLDWNVNIKEKTIGSKNGSLLSLDELKLQGIHNGLNIAASLALLDASKIEITDNILDAAKSYSGLEHRCQKVIKKNGITFINDSKATNVGATVAAVESFKGLFDSIILIAGGDAKGADLSGLNVVLNDSINSMVVFGKDAKALSLLASEKSYLVEDMAQALVKSLQLIKEKRLKNCLVLLSPACASLDMYKNYQERGDKFSSLARAIA